MANEITEIGQFATYGGPQLTLAGSDLASKLTSLLTREGSGSARGWRLFDPAKADYLNTKKVLSPGDVVLVNARALPMDFPIQVNSTGVTLPQTIDISQTDNGPVNELEDDIAILNLDFTPSLLLTAGAATVELVIAGVAKEVSQVGKVPAGTRFNVRVNHTVPVSGILTLTFS